MSPCFNRGHMDYVWRKEASVDTFPDLCHQLKESSNPNRGAKVQNKRFRLMFPTWCF